jgi:chorismate mutase
MSNEELKNLRSEIDSIDKKIISLVEKRVETAKKIGTIKEKKGLPVSDPAREKEVLDNASSTSKLDKEFIKKLFSSIIEYCKDAEQK